MKIGIFGGTFNPPHRAHLNIARDFCQRLSLDRVVIIPTFEPPHKQAKALVSGEHRLEMCRLLFSDDRFTVSDIEIKRQGKSYTYDTLCALEKEYAGAQLYLIIGSDMLMTFHQWYRYTDILKKCTLCVMTREDGIDNGIMRKYASEKLGLRENEIEFSSLGPMEMSSTEIREKLLRGEEPEAFLTEEIIEYIREKELYDE